MDATRCTLIPRSISGRTRQFGSCSGSWVASRSSSASAPTSGTRSGRCSPPADHLASYRAFRALQWVMERLPRGLAYALAVLVARFAFLFARTARRRLEENLRHVLGDAPEADIRRLAWLNFRNHSKAYADLMRLPRARVESPRQLLTVEGENNLEAALALGHGVLVVGAHMGSWEEVAAIWSATIAPVSLFAEELE